MLEGFSGLKVPINESSAELEAVGWGARIDLLLFHNRIHTKIEVFLLLTHASVEHASLCSLRIRLSRKGATASLAHASVEEVAAAFVTCIRRGGPSCVNVDSADVGRRVHVPVTCSGGVEQARFAVACCDGGARCESAVASIRRGRRSCAAATHSC